MEYILVPDNDSHWYVIPLEKHTEWDKWCCLDENDEKSWVVPEYAEQVGGPPFLVKFKQYRIE
jgi:hypothetical protein